MGASCRKLSLTWDCGSEGIGLIGFVLFLVFVLVGSVISFRRATALSSTADGIE
jgi:hypothetical protein